MLEIPHVAATTAGSTVGNMVMLENVEKSHLQVITNKVLSSIWGALQDDGFNIIQKIIIHTEIQNL